MFSPSCTYLLLKAVHLNGARSKLIDLKVSLLNKATDLTPLMSLGFFVSSEFMVQLVPERSNQWMKPSGYPPVALQ